MILEELGIKSGTWLVVNCGSMPSDNNCQVVIAAPANQREDLIDAASEHAADKHGHDNDEQLHTAIAGLVQTVEV